MNTSPETCRWDGCTATHPLFAPKVCTPAKGVGINSIRPLSCICNMPLCADHIKALPVTDLLTDDAREGFVRAAASIGKAVPDFDRAWIQPVSINSPEYRNRKGKA